MERAAGNFLNERPGRWPLKKARRTAQFVRIRSKEGYEFDFSSSLLDASRLSVDLVDGGRFKAARPWIEACLSLVRAAMSAQFREEFRAVDDEELNEEAYPLDNLEVIYVDLVARISATLKAFGRPLAPYGDFVELARHEDWRAMAFSQPVPLEYLPRNEPPTLAFPKPKPSTKLEPDLPMSAVRRESVDSTDSSSLEIKLDSRRLTESTGERLRRDVRSRAQMDGRPRSLASLSIVGEK
jgi:hypothetical protein